MINCKMMMVRLKYYVHLLKTNTEVEVEKCLIRFLIVVCTKWLNDGATLLGVHCHSVSLVYSCSVSLTVKVVERGS